MKTSNLLTLLMPGMLSFALASIQDRDAACLTKSEAANIVARWTSIAITINTTVVDETATNDFKFYPDSQDFLEGLPLSPYPAIPFPMPILTPSTYGLASTPQTPSINGKQDLINQQEAAQTPGTVVIPQYFTIFQIMHSCESITFRWRFHAEASGGDPTSTNMAGDPIDYAGIDVLILQPSTKLIKKADSEWNNGELLHDLGERVCFQKENASACS